MRSFFRIGPWSPNRRGALFANNPNHHIWCNNGTYFIHVTVRLNGRTKLRLRRSLLTKDVFEARRRRDRFLDSVREQPAIELLMRSAPAR